jgi:hypothetical protein
MQDFEEMAGIRVGALIDGLVSLEVFLPEIRAVGKMSPEQAEKIAQELEERGDLPVKDGDREFVIALPPDDAARLAREIRECALLARNPAALRAAIEGQRVAQSRVLMN